MKLGLLLSVAALLLYGWIKPSYTFAMAGAILFAVHYLIDLISLIKFSKDYNNGKDKPKKTPSNYKQVTDAVGMVIMFSGMFASLNDAPLFRTPGIVIWGGTILAYILSGIFIQTFAKIPLEMGYGGWKIKSFRRRYK